MVGVSKLLSLGSEPSDALRYGRRPVERRPVVVWNSTPDCNLKCRHCYAQPKGAGRTMTTAEARAMIDGLADFGCPALLFSGGEPALRGDIAELVRHARRKGLLAVLSTNGTLLDAGLVARLADAGLSYAGISVDGPPAVHDAFRGVAGAFDAALAGLRNAAAAGLKVGLRTTLCRANARHVPYIFGLMKREGVARACFYHLVYTGRGGAMAAEDLSREETRSAVSAIVDLTREWQAAGGRPEILTVDNHADGPFVCLRLLESDARRARAALELLETNRGESSGNGIAAIGWDGEVYADQFSRHRPLGNVLERSFSSIWTSERLKPYKDKRPYLPAKCRACRFLNACGGNSRVRAEAATGDFWGMDPQCYLTDREIA